VNFENMNQPGWIGDQLSAEFSRQGHRIAEQLRWAADRIDSLVDNVSISPDDRLRDHNQTAASILSEINSMHGNMSTSGLLNAAAVADRHLRNPRED
jgi:hypothetical protein